MITIERDMDRASNETFDIIVIGGGIYGACTLLEASRRGLKCVLLESEDFGGATSWNSLRIIHGGLRYLQNLDLRRFYRSVSEQAWWLQNFPDIVSPLTCMMPLYNKGLRRSSVLRAALKLNDVMAATIRGRFDVRLEPGHMLSDRETVARFPLVKEDGLCGSAVWSDAIMKSPQRLLMEVLRWAVAAGGLALNYTRVEGLNVCDQEGGKRVIGVTATCRTSDRTFDVAGRSVINCAGANAAELASKFAKRLELPSANSNIAKESRNNRNHLARAFNVVVNRSPFANEAVAVSSRRNTYFCVPCSRLSEGETEVSSSNERKMMIGTVHLPSAKCGSNQPTEQELLAFIDDLNLAVPKLKLQRSDVTVILAGQLPSERKGSQLPRKSPMMSTIRDVMGFLTVEGVKYTTARSIADIAIRKVLRQSARDTKLGLGFTLPSYGTEPRPIPQSLSDLDLEMITASELQSWIHCESVVHLDDLLLRRTDLPFDASLRQIAVQVLTKLDWNEVTREAEMKRLEEKTGLRTV